MSVARITAEINLKDNLSQPLKNADDNIKRFSSNARGEFKKLSAEASKSLSEFGEKIGGISQKAQTAGIALTAALTAPILLLAKNGIKAASDLNETFTKTQAVFRDSSTGVTAFAKKAADVLGLAEQAALDYASTFGLILQAGGATEAQSAKMSLSLSALSADLASFYNVDIADAAVKLKAGLVGEAEPLRAFGVLLSENAVKARGLSMGFKMVRGDLSMAAKVQARYSIILEQTKKAQGDFGRTSDGLANSTRILQANLKNLSADLGAILLPYVKEGVKRLVELVDKFKNLSPEVKKNIIVFGGIAAALGPVLLVFGSIGNSLAGVISLVTKGGGAFSALSKFVATSGGAMGLLRTAFAALTGPIGLAIATVVALGVAYKTNFAGIRDSLNALWSNVTKFVADIVGEIQHWINENKTTILAGWEFIKVQLASTLRIIVNVISIAWEVIKVVVGQALRVTMGLITVFTNLLQGNWKGAWEAIKTTVLNVWYTIQAGIARVSAGILRLIQNMIQGVANGFNALQNLFGQKGADVKVTFLDGAIKGLEDLANGYDKAREKAVGFKPAALPNPFATVAGTGGKNLMSLPDYNNPGAGATGGGTDARKKPRINPDIAELARLTNELAAARLKAAGAAARDVIAMGEYGKLFEKVLDPLKRSIILKKAEAQAYEDATSLSKSYSEAVAGLRTTLDKSNATSEREKSLIDLRASELYGKLLPAQKKELENLTLGIIARENMTAKIQAENEARRGLADSVRAYVESNAKSVDTLYATSNAEKARWETTKGGFKDATGLQKFFIVASAKILDQAEATKAAGEKWRSFWAGVKNAAQELNQSTQKSSKDKYDEYIKRLTTRMLELRGASEEVLRADLTEQFKGLGIGAKTAAEGTLAVKKAVDDILDRSRANTQLERYIADIQGFADKLESAFTKVLDNLFENGFRGFFSSVVSGFRDMVREIMLELVKLQIRRAVVGLIGQVFGSDAKASLKAVGGSVEPGNPYIVGDNGPELFIPRGSGGTIVPNYAMGGATGGGTTNITVNLKAPGYQAFRKSEGQLVAEAFGRANRARQRDGRG